MKETVLFIGAISIMYLVPWKFTGCEWAGWIGVLVVYIFDMGRSRLKWPDEMNTPTVTKSEWMTYVGMAGASILMVLSVFGVIEGFRWFVWYLLGGSFIYFIWKTA